MGGEGRGREEGKREEGREGGTYLGCVRTCVIGFVGFDDGDDAVWVDWDGRYADPIARVDDKLFVYMR